MQKADKSIQLGRVVTTGRSELNGRLLCCREPKIGQAHPQPLLEGEEIGYFFRWDLRQGLPELRRNHDGLAVGLDDFDVPLRVGDCIAQQTNP